MVENEIYEELVHVIKENQKVNGVRDPHIHELTCPVTDLDYFDSLTAIEVITVLEVIFDEKYDIKCELDADLFFTINGEKGNSNRRLHTSLTINQVANNIFNELKRKS